MGVGINIPFFAFSFAAIVASAIVSTVVELIARGDGGKVTYFFSFLAAFVGAFLALHWDYIGVWTTAEEWIRHSAIASNIVMALLFSAIGSSIGKSIGKALTTPAWLKDDEDAAIKAISKEKNQGKLHVAAAQARSYRVRAIACEKLGRQQGAKYEIALHDPNEAVCLAALDEADWNGWDQLLAEIAIGSDKEAVALKALGKIRDDAAFGSVAAKSKNETISSKALSQIRDDAILADAIAKMAGNQSAVEAISRIKNPDALARLCKQSGPYASPAPMRFEAGRRLGDSEACAAALNDILETDANGVKAALGSIGDAGFLAEVVTRWLGNAKKPSAIVEKLKGRAILEPPIDDRLEGFCCSDGCLHDFESTIAYKHAGSDDYDGNVYCKRCGYLYTVDRTTYRSGKYLFGCRDKQVLCKSGGYICAKCCAKVLPEGDGPAPCLCPKCGADNHHWEHVDNVIDHRDYSSGSRWDECTRCHQKKNLENVYTGGM